METQRLDDGSLELDHGYDEDHEEYYTDEEPTRLRIPALVLLIGGVIGVGASIMLLLDRLRLMSDSSYIPVCNMNDVLSCSTVIESAQASVLGDLPNPVIGILLFPVVITTAVVLLTGARLPDWYWGLFFAGIISAVAFIHWLAWQSFFEIGALCPWCMVVWLATMCIFAAALAAMSKLGHFPAWLARWSWLIVVIWVAGIVTLAFIRFGNWLA